MLWYATYILCRLRFLQLERGCRTCAITARPLTRSRIPMKPWPQTFSTFSTLTNCPTSPYLDTPCTFPCMFRSRTNILTRVRGGKVAMSVALSPELPSNLLSHLIVADIAPSRGPLSAEFTGYVEAMQKIEESNVKTRQEADRVLRPYEQVRTRLSSR